MYDVAIIGGGIVGCAAAFELSKYRVSALLLEKENDLSMGASRANSGIIHAGYDPKPGSLMARLNVRGADLAAGLCAELGVSYKRTGSLVVAFTREDTSLIDELYARGLKNGVSGLRVLSGSEALAMEPSLSPSVIGALLAPTAAIVNPWEYAFALGETACRNGVDIRLSSPVTALSHEDGAWRIDTPRGTFCAKYIINCAGVSCADIQELASQREYISRPKRGEYYIFDKTAGSTVSRVIFQCPGEHGKGVLVAPTVHGNLIVGPNADPLTAGGGTETTRAGLLSVRETALQSVPSLHFDDSIRNFAGVRAVTDREDFIVGFSETAPDFINAAGIKSPGLSSAPAIAEMAAGLLRCAGLALCEKDEWSFAPKRVRFNELSPDERAELVRQDPLYGRIICRCETVTEGEIVRALRGVLPPRSLDGIKRRCGTGMGRCQGGFCGPRLVEILCREPGLRTEDILQDGDGSFLFCSDTPKGGAADV